MTTYFHGRGMFAVCGSRVDSLRISSEADPIRCPSNHNVRHSHVYVVVRSEDVVVRKEAADIIRAAPHVLWAVVSEAALRGTLLRNQSSNPRYPL